jgi:hypothetical protein
LVSVPGPRASTSVSRDSIEPCALLPPCVTSIASATSVNYT